MGLLSREPKPEPLDRETSLASIPALNPDIRTEIESDGRVLVRVPVPRRNSGFLARFQPPVSERQYRLDELGAFVLDQIDGRKTVAEIVSHFVERFRTTRREAELSTAEFLKTLAARRIISIGVR